MLSSGALCVEEVLQTLGCCNKTGCNNLLHPFKPNHSKVQERITVGSPDFILSGSEGTPRALVMVTKTRKRGEPGLLHSGYRFCSHSTELSNLQGLTRDQQGRAAKQGMEV